MLVRPQGMRQITHFSYYRELSPNNLLVFSKEMAYNGKKNLLILQASRFSEKKIWIALIFSLPFNSSEKRWLRKISVSSTEEQTRLTLELSLC
jgi:hypothetical protein